MPYVMLKDGGSITFMRNGESVCMRPGSKGHVPERIFQRHPGRFVEVDGPPAEAMMPVETMMPDATALPLPQLQKGPITPIPHEPADPIEATTTQMQSGVTRQPEFFSIERPPAKPVEPQPQSSWRYAIRHRGAGKWYVWDTIAGKAVGDLKSRDEAQAESSKLNGVT
jgi:hypothetical protein